MDLSKTVNKITHKRALILLIIFVLIYDLSVWKRDIISKKGLFQKISFP